jgi:Flp pilus assembly protein TadB
MSTTISKIIILVGVSLLLGGCAAIVGTNGITALVVSLIAAAGAGWGMMYTKDENRVCRKAQELDNAVSVHVERYQRSSSGDTVVNLRSANKTNGATEPDSVSRLSQRM